MVNSQRARLVGIVTFVELVYFVVYGIWFGFTIARLASGTGHLPNRGLFFAVWVTNVIYVIVALALLVFYLRHLNRCDDAPQNKVLWTVLLFLGPIAMSYYWLHYLRPAMPGTA